MKKILIDSRAAGQGKTTAGIYPRIKRFYELGQNILVVVPSIRLQHQYRDNLNDIPWCIINSEDTTSTSVSLQIISALIERRRAVCITHEAFKTLEIHHSIKRQYHLIIDEVFMPYGFLEVVMDPKIKLGLDQVFYPRDVVISGRWNQLERNTIENSTFLNQSRDWAKLTDPLTRVWTDSGSWEKILVGDMTKIYFGLELDPVIIQGWQSVWIAAAAFHMTFMGLWLLYNGFEFEIKHPFIPHRRVPTFHSPQRLRYSRNFRENNPEVFEEFHQYIQGVIQGQECLAVKNNDEIRSMTDEVKLTHNAHGMNSYTNFRNIYLASSLNPSPKFHEFLADMSGLDTDEECHKFIVAAMAGYTYYQLILRTHLRLPNEVGEVNVFLLDHEIQAALLEFFDLDELSRTSPQVIPNLSQVKKAKKAPLTKKEQNHRAYLKRKSGNKK